MVTLEAKNVVVARALPREGRVEVLESWRGDLRPGTWLSLSDIASVASDTRRLVYSQNRPTRNCLGVDRMVLFLSEKPDHTWVMARGPALSLLILERGKTWAPSLPKSYPGFGELGYDETELHARIVLTGSYADELSAASALEDKAEKARTLAPLVVSPFLPVRGRAMQAIRACGADAASALRALVRRDSNLAYRSDLLSLLKDASPEVFVEELRALLAAETRYWKRIGGTLEDNWWSGAGASGPDEAEELKTRLGQTRYLLDWARSANDAKATENAAALTAVWATEKPLAPVANWVGVNVNPGCGKR